MFILPQIWLCTSLGHQQEIYRVWCCFLYIFRERTKKFRQAEISYLKVTFSLFLFFLSLFVSSPVGPLGVQPSKLADWGSSGPESNTNCHGPASTLPRMTSQSNSNTEQGERHAHFGCMVMQLIDNGMSHFCYIFYTVISYRTFHKLLCMLFFFNESHHV